MCMMYHDAYALRIPCGGGDPPPDAAAPSSRLPRGVYPPTQLQRIGGGIPPLGGLGDISVIIVYGKFVSAGTLQAESRSQWR